MGGTGVALFVWLFVCEWLDFAAEIKAFKMVVD